MKHKCSRHLPDDPNCSLNQERNGTEEIQMLNFVATRYHDFSYAHRLREDKGKCKHIHGHNARVTFAISGIPDEQGMVIPFDDIKESLCEWVEKNWDHKLLLDSKDPLIGILTKGGANFKELGIVVLPFNPTAENLAAYLLMEIGSALQETSEESDDMNNIEVVGVEWEETRKTKIVVSKSGKATEEEIEKARQEEILQQSR